MPRRPVPCSIKWMAGYVKARASVYGRDEQARNRRALPSGAEGRAVHRVWGFGG